MVLPSQVAVLAAVLACASGPGCGASPPGPVEEASPVPVGSLSSAVTVPQRLRGLVETQVRGVAAGDDARLVSALAEDVFVLGPMADAIVLGREDVQELAQRVLPEGAEVEASLDEHALEVSADGQSAWSFHDVLLSDPDERLAVRVSTVFERRSGTWVIAAQAWTLPVTDERAMQIAADRGFPELPEVEPRAGEGTDALVARASAWRQNMIIPAEPSVGALGVGSAPGELTRAADQDAEAMQRAIDEGSLSVEPVGGGVRAQRVGGDLAWVFYQQLYGIGPEQLRLEMPLRVFEVYQAHADGWRLVHAHVSLPVEL